MQPLPDSLAPQFSPETRAQKKSKLPWIIGVIILLVVLGVGGWYFVFGGFFSVTEDSRKITCGEVTIEAERSFLVFPTAVLKGRDSTHAYSNITFTVGGKTLIAQHNAQSVGSPQTVDMRSNNDFPPGDSIEKAYILDTERFQQTEDQSFGGVIKGIDDEGTDFFVFSHSSMGKDDFETAARCLRENKATLEEATQKTIMGAALLVEGVKLGRISSYIDVPGQGRGMTFLCPSGPSLRLANNYIAATTEPLSPVRTDTEDIKGVGFTSLRGVFYPTTGAKEIDPSLRNAESWAECKNAEGQNIGQYIEELATKVVVIE